MKKICILVEDQHIAEAREAAKKIIKSQVLTVPLSSNGEKPASHWFCHLSVSDEGYQAIKDLQKYSVIEHSSPKSFLKKWKLKTISSTKDS